MYAHIKNTHTLCRKVLLARSPLRTAYRSTSAPQAGPLHA